MAKGARPMGLRHNCRITLRVCGSSEQATAFIRWREIVARDMVQAHWLHIGLLAGQLFERKCLNHADLDAILVPRGGVIQPT